jgi:hypothetical protein
LPLLIFLFLILQGSASAFAVVSSLPPTPKESSSRPKQWTVSPSIAQWRDPRISPLLLPVLAFVLALAVAFVFAVAVACLEGVNHFV